MNSICVVLLVLLGITLSMSIIYQIINSKNMKVRIAIFIEIVLIIIAMFSVYSIGKYKAEQEYQSLIASDSEGKYKIFDTKDFSVYISYK